MTLDYLIFINLHQRRKCVVKTILMVKIYSLSLERSKTQILTHVHIHIQICLRTKHSFFVL